MYIYIYISYVYIHIYTYIYMYINSISRIASSVRQHISHGLCRIVHIVYIMSCRSYRSHHVAHRSCHVVEPASAACWL